MSDLMMRAEVNQTLLVEARKKIQRLSRKLNDNRDGLRAWSERYLNPRTKNTFEKLAQGGSYRGVTWAPYLKSTLGTVRSTRHKRTRVFGNMRNNGEKYTSKSKLLQATGELKKAALKPVLRLSRNSMEVRLDSKVGERGWAQATGRRANGHITNPRPFLFLEVPRDVKALEEFILSYAMEVASHAPAAN